MTGPRPAGGPHAALGATRWLRPCPASGGACCKPLRTRGAKPMCDESSRSWSASGEGAGSALRAATRPTRTRHMRAIRTPTTMKTPSPAQRGARFQRLANVSTDIVRRRIWLIDAAQSLRARRWRAGRSRPEIPEPNRSRPAPKITAFGGDRHVQFAWRSRPGEHLRHPVRRCAKPQRSYSPRWRASTARRRSRLSCGQ